MDGELRLRGPENGVGFFNVARLEDYGYCS